MWEHLKELMNKELSILKNINSVGNTTQRDIAKKTGISLGNVNAAIKNLILKGYLHKITNSEREVKYVLTKEGERNKSIALLNRYSEIIDLTLSIQKQIEETVNDLCIKRGLFPILVGEDNEIKTYLIKALNKMDIGFEERKIAEVANINYNVESKIIIIWHPDAGIQMKDADIRYINIIDKIEL